jgi:SAM-dependent methyltransferase
LSIEKWNQRYRSVEQLFDAPSPVVARFTADLAAGAALDLACGSGRNALYLAERGWRVTAVDGSPVAIAKLRERNIDINAETNPEIDARVADLEGGEFQIQPDSYDLICDCYYLQRDLFPHIKNAIRRGGMAIVIVHLSDRPCESATRMSPGELRAYFTDWKIVHYREGQPDDPYHQRAVAELVAVR